MGIDYIQASVLQKTCHGLLTLFAQERKMIYLEDLCQLIDKYRQFKVDTQQPNLQKKAKIIKG